MVLGCLKYRLGIRKLLRKKKKIYVSYLAELRKVKNNGGLKDDIDAIEASAAFENAMIMEEISILITNYYRALAAHYFLPMPPLEDEGVWEQCSITSYQWVLTNKGISELRSTIRKEKRERLELALTIIAMVTGVIGAITGLCAVILK